MQFLSKTDWQNGGCFDLLTRIPVRYFGFAQYGAAQQPGGTAEKAKEGKEGKEGNAMCLDRLAPKSPEGGLETCAFSLSLLKDH